MKLNDFQPEWVCPPGKTVADLLHVRGLSVSELAERLGRPEGYIQELLDGRAAITLRIAAGLSKELGASPEFWMARDSQYRQDAARIHGEGRSWIRSLPLRDMIRFGWLPETPTPSEELGACLSFFGVPSLGEWHKRYDRVVEAVAFRTSQAYESNPVSTAAWLRQGELQASRMACQPWNKEHFQGVLTNSRSLTSIDDPQEFLPRLAHMCGTSGVALCVARAPKGCRASAATTFVSANKAMILLSFRFLTDDQFWFSFYHEAGHLVLHTEESLFLEGLEPTNPVFEEQANEFAEQVLFPGTLREELASVGPQLRQILRFAKKAGISPGLVVGQMQHRHMLPNNYFNSLKVRYAWDQQYG